MNDLRVEPLNPHSPDAAELLAALTSSRAAFIPPRAPTSYPLLNWLGPKRYFWEPTLMGSLSGAAGMFSTMDMQN